jgi:hypothetical protein
MDFPQASPYGKSQTHSIKVFNVRFILQDDFSGTGKKSRMEVILQTSANSSLWEIHTPPSGLRKNYGPKFRKNYA